MDILVSYPVLIIIKREPVDDVGLVTLKEAESDKMTHGLAVFTDKDAARTFRDEHYPGWSIGRIPDEAHLAGLLTVLQKKLSWIAFDPYRKGTRPLSIPLLELLSQMNQE